MMIIQMQYCVNVFSNKYIFQFECIFFKKMNKYQNIQNG